VIKDIRGFYAVSDLLNVLNKLKIISSDEYYSAIGKWYIEVPVDKQC